MLTPTVRNFGILLALAHYLLFLTHWLPRWGLSVARLLLERLALRLGEPGGARPSPVTRDGEGGTGGTGGIGGTGGTGDVAERSGLFDGFAKCVLTDGEASLLAKRVLMA